MTRIMENHALNDAETTFIKKDGARVWVQITAALTKDKYICDLFRGGYQ